MKLPIKVLMTFVIHSKFFFYVGVSLAGPVTARGPEVVEDADHAVCAMFELQPVTSKQLLKIV